MCCRIKVLYIYHMNIIEMAPFLRTQFTFYLHFKTNVNLKFSYPCTYSFPWFHLNLNAWIIKQRLSTNIYHATRNTQEWLWTETHWPSPQHFLNYKYRYQKQFPTCFLFSFYSFLKYIYYAITVVPFPLPHSTPSCPPPPSHIPPL